MYVQVNDHVPILRPEWVVGKLPGRRVVDIRDQRFASTKYLMVGWHADLRRTSTNPALRKADTTPVWLETKEVHDLAISKPSSSEEEALAELEDIQPGKTATIEYTFTEPAPDYRA